MDNKQNATLMITATDEITGEVKLTYVPMTLDLELLEFILDRGSNCENKNAVWFDLDEDEDTFWTNMWNDLMEDVDE